MDVENDQKKKKQWKSALPGWALEYKSGHWVWDFLNGLFDVNFPRKGLFCAYLVKFKQKIRLF